MKYDFILYKNIDLQRDCQQYFIIRPICAQPDGAGIRHDKIQRFATICKTVFPYLEK